MTKLLEQAFDKARMLTREQQDSLGALLLEEIEADAAWEHRLDASPDVLSRLAAEACAEAAAGHVTEEDPGTRR